MKSTRVVGFRKFILASLSVSVVWAVSCRERSPKENFSEEKATLIETPYGAELVLDMQECISAKVFPTTGEVFTKAIDEVSHQVEERIKEHPDLKKDTLSALEVIKSKIDFNGVTDDARLYLESQKEAIYYNLGFAATNLLPSGFIVGFYHPVFKLIPMDKLTSKVGLPAKFFPFIGVVVVPTCYYSVDATGKRGSLKTRIRVGGIANFLWQFEKKNAASPAGDNAESVATDGAPGTTNGSNAESWRVIVGATFMSLIDPNQLTGGVLGFGIARTSGTMTAPGKHDVKPFATKNGTIRNMDPKASQGGSFGFVYRPMVVFGSKKPRPKTETFVDAVFDSIKNPIEGDFSGLIPTHLMMLVDIYGKPTKVNYTKFYGGFNFVTSDLMEKFLARPVEVESETGRLTANIGGDLETPRPRPSRKSKSKSDNDSINDTNEFGN